MRTSSEPAAASALHLRDRRGDVRGIGVGHRLDDDRCAAADGDAGDVDARVSWRAARRRSWLRSRSNCSGRAARAGMIRASATIRSVRRVPALQQARAPDAEGASSARKRSGTRNGRSGGLWRATAAVVQRVRSTEGVRTRQGAPDLSGHKDRGAAGAAVAPAALFFAVRGCADRGSDMGRRTPLYDLHVGAGRAHGRLRRLGHAGRTTARRSRSITPCAAPPACSTSRTCASSICRGRRARVPPPPAGQRRRAPHDPRQGALQLHAE